MFISHELINLRGLKFCLKQFSSCDHEYKKLFMNNNKNKLFIYFECVIDPIF